MPANLLIFDADYISELTAKMNTACELFSEAVTSLKSATNHENWKCKERARIADEFDELNLKLGRLDTGVNETTRILGGSVSRFASLESQYDSQANTLSDELTSNHGFSASVRTGGGDSPERTSRNEEESENDPGTAGAAGAAGAIGASAGQAVSQAGGNGQTSGAGGARGSLGGLHIHAGGNMFNRRNNDTGNSGSGTFSNGTGPGASAMSGAMNVNLPVTHIPDNPGAAARGIKHTQAIADAALSSVAGAISEMLGNGNQGAGFDAAATRLNEAYNAGRSIFESSSAIIASPSQPHTSERLAMAAGIVALAQGTGNFQTVSVSATGNFAQNAGLISSALQGNSGASELRDILAAVSGQNTTGISASGVTGSVSSSAGNNGSFFDMIVEEIKKIFSGGQESVSSSSHSGKSLESSPITEFLEKFVTEAGGVI